MRDIRSFAGCDLLVPLACASDGFQNGLTARLCRDVRIADDQAQGAALANVAEGAFDRGYKLQQVGLGCAGGVSGFGCQP